MNINAKPSNLLQAGKGTIKTALSKKAKTHMTKEDKRRMHTSRSANVRHTKQLNICTFPIFQEHQH